LSLYISSQEAHEKAQQKEYLNLSEQIRKELEKRFPRREETQSKDVSWVSSFTEIQKEAVELAKAWGKTINDVSVEHSAYDDYGSYVCEVKLEVKGLETEPQYHSRLWEIHVANGIRDEHDRKEFKRLKKKFKYPHQAHSPDGTAEQRRYILHDSVARAWSDRSESYCRWSLEVWSYLVPLLQAHSGQLAHYVCWIFQQSLCSC
jgi:hypothetical protein